jgi:hypothetical protein
MINFAKAHHIVPVMWLYAGGQHLCMEHDELRPTLNNIKQ